MIPQVNGIYRTYSVSFPRSGHHWLVRMLSNYFGDRLSYCESYQYEHRRHELCPETNLTKTHDFDLDLPVRDDCIYLIQLRNPVTAITGWIRMDERNEGRVFRPGHWRALFRQRMKFYRRFVEKWVTRDIGAPRLVVPYESLLVRPEDSLCKIINFLADEPVDFINIMSAVEPPNPNPTKSEIFEVV